MSENERSTPSWFGNGCAIAFLLAILIPGAFFVTAMLRDGGDTIMLRGEVVLSDPAKYGISPQTCSSKGDMLRVNSHRVNLRIGSPQPDGSCVFEFSERVRDVDRYEFELIGTDATVRSSQRSFIDTQGPTGVELKVTLRW